MGELILPVLFWVTAGLIVAALITEFRTASPNARRITSEGKIAEENSEQFK